MTNYLDSMKSLVEEAREWLGTPWHHNQKVKGKGVDCIRFVESLAESQGIEIGFIPAHYTRSTQDERLLEFLRDRCLEKPLSLNNIEDGDIMVLKYRGVPHHLAIASTLPDGRRGIIHASEDGVVEQGFEGRLLLIWVGLFSLKKDSRYD
jgi:cell wall-associated NlpC family hydrolase